MDPSRTEQLSEDCFRLKMRPLKFMMLSIQPIVDLQLWAESDGTIHLQSVACELLGIEYLNRRFSLKLRGKLYPRQVRRKTRLTGRADLCVQVELPPPFLLTPAPILEAAGNGLLKSVLLTIKQRLMHNLLADYCKWSKLVEQPSTQLPPQNVGQTPILPV